MNTEMLNLSPKEFADRTWPCQDGREYILQATSMEDAWERCNQVDWLLWCLGKLGATGFTDYARWCFDQIPVRSSKKKSASRKLNLVVEVERENEAYIAALGAMDLAILSGQTDNPAEVKRRWGNPFRKEEMK
jgi:hypothetical protein